MAHWLLRCSTMSTPHDALFKAVFGNPEHARGALQAVVPARLAEALDWLALVNQPGSFVEPGIPSQHTDLLFSVAWRDGRGEVPVHFLFEHQSTLPDGGLMAFRLLRYKVRIWDRWHAEHPKVESLPLIVPMMEPQTLTFGQLAAIMLKETAVGMLIGVVLGLPLWAAEAAGEIAALRHVGDEQRGVVAELVGVLRTADADGVHDQQVGAQVDDVAGVLGPPRGRAGARVQRVDAAVAAHADVRAAAREAAPVDRVPLPPAHGQRLRVERRDGVGHLGLQLQFDPELEKMGYLVEGVLGALPG